MALFSSYGDTESQFARVGDSHFVGMDYRTAPDKLPEGVYSYGENVRVRSREVATRPGNPYINWFFPDSYPWDVEYNNGGVQLTGTWNETGYRAGSGKDGDVTVVAGTTSGTPYADGYDHIRFGAGSGPALVLKATGEESGGLISVETDPVANSQTVTAEEFVWCKNLKGDEDSFKDLTRSVVTNASPTQTVITTGIFRDPKSNDYAVIVTDTSTWFGSEYNRPFEVTIPDGVDDTAYLLQCFDKLLLFRGKKQKVLEYSYANPFWQEIDATNVGDYTLPIPNAERALFFQNRVWVHVDDNLYFSDIGEYTRYYWLENELRVNVGENDSIVALFPFGKHAMLIFKKNSIYYLDNLYGDVAANMRLQIISKNIGCGGAETIANVGNRVWFCDESGHVWDISQVDADRAEISGEPVSWPIHPLWEEKGSRNVSTWAAAYHDSYYYLFIDTDSGNWGLPDWALPGYDNLNRIAVYDIVNEAWVSLDWDGSLNAIGRPIILSYMGAKRLMFVDKASGNLRVIGYGGLDGTRASGSGRQSGDPWAEFVTRGYYAEKGKEQSFAQVRTQIARFDNDLQVYALTDGIGESELIFSDNINNSNRNTYLNANESSGFSEWTQSNVNEDFTAPYRKDYSLFPTNSGTGVNLTSSGVQTNLYQSYKYVQRINELGNFVQLKFVSDGGRFRVKDASVAIRGNMGLQGERV